MARTGIGIATLAAVMVCLGAPARAETGVVDPRQEELKAAGQAARAAAQEGPRDIPLAGQGVLHLPQGLAFIPPAEAERFMVALGNAKNPKRIGLIVPLDKQSTWLADLDWISEGHVPDGDAADWQPDAMLDSLKQGTEEQNKDRIARGIPAMDIVGWIEPPTYDKAAHRLIWSLAATGRGDPAGTPQTVNYNTYALAREGFVSLDMITSSATVGPDKQAARALLADIAFAPGKRYEDFNPSTDHMAEYGLAALVGAVAVKKLGLLALIGAFALKAWKIALFVVLGGWAATKRFFGRLFNRNKPEPEPAEPAHEAPTDPAEGE